MARQKLSYIDLISAIQSKVESKTSLKCYDAVPLNAPSPFYFAEVVGTEPINTKSMYRETYTVWIHAIAEATSNGSSIGLYNLIQNLEEALTEDITLNSPYQLLNQTSSGVLSIQKDETGEKHAILKYDFDICYGFICK